MTNAEIRQIVFDEIRRLGFKVYNVQNVDGYFIFEGAKDSITHFRIKGKGMWKHWKFGLWVHSEYMTEEELDKVRKNHCDGDWGNEPKVIQLFAQHDTWMDKFKPSRCNLLVEIDNDSLDEYLTQNRNSLYRIENMLRMMIKHPFMCYNEYCGESVGFTDTSFFLNYITSELKDKWTIFKKKAYTAFWLPYTKIKIALCRNSKVIDHIELFDFEKEMKGWSTDYLYEVRIVFAQDADTDEMAKWVNRWWKREEYGKYAWYDKVISVDLFRQIGRDGYFRFVDEE